MLRCHEVGHPDPGGGCPEIPAADLAASSDPAFPDRVVVNIQALAPGESYTQRLRFWDKLCWPNGQYQLAATADAGHVVAESNEANNQSESVLTSQRQCPAGGQKPDLVIHAFGLKERGKCAPGNAVFTFQVTVANIGTAPSPAVTDVALVQARDTHAGINWGNGVIISESIHPAGVRPC